MCKLLQPDTEIFILFLDKILKVILHNTDTHIVKVSVLREVHELIPDFFLNTETVFHFFTFCYPCMSLYLSQ